MKNKLLIILLISQSVFGQIDFQRRIVTENINSTPFISSIKEIDMDGDGDIDLLSADGGNVKWFENIDGSNTEINSHTIADIIRGNYIDAADMDNDGDIDIVLQNTTALYYIENLGENIFSSPRTLFDTNNTNNNFYSFSISDLDSDGDFDIIYCFRKSPRSSSLKWFENIDGRANFNNRDIEIYGGVRSVTAGDIDGDNDIDIIAYNHTIQEIELFKNNGSQNFIKERITEAFYNGFATLNAGDIDNDGDLDLLITDSEGYSSSPVIVKVMKNDGLGNFLEYQSIIVDVMDFSYLVLNDIDGDGDLDVVFSSFENKTIGWLENTDGFGTLSSHKIIDDQIEGAKFIISYDFDFDGNIDILAASQKHDNIVFYRKNAVNDDFEAPIKITSSISNPNKVMAVDIDGDGDLDILSSSEDGKLTWYKNKDGYGNYGAQNIIGAEILSVKTFGAKDLDGDGDIDVVCGDDHSNIGSEFFWFENLDGNGSFSSKISLGTHPGLTYVIPVDLDNDGDNDILYKEGWSTNSIAWLENLDGLGDFSEKKEIAISNSQTNGKIEISDINNDGLIDVIIEGFNTYSWYANDGNGNFIENVIEVNSSYAKSFTVFDYDGDNDMDIIIGFKTDYSGPNKIGWLENTDGQGTFGSIEVIDENISNIISSSDYELYSEDLNNDGLIDIITRSHNWIGWYENTDSFGTYLPHTSIFNSDFISNDLFIADIDQDGLKDVVCTYSLSSYGDEYINDKLLWYKNEGLVTNEINGFVRLDELTNGCSPSNMPLSNIMVKTTHNMESLATFTLENGFYQLFPSEGNHNTSIGGQLPDNYVSNPLSQESVFSDTGNIDTVNFCIEPVSNINDVSINIYPISGPPRPGFETSYQIVYKNNGTSQITGNIVFQFDDTKIQFLSASETISSQTQDSLIFSYLNLSPFEKRAIELKFNVYTPPTTSIGDNLISTASIDPIAGDETEDNNVFTLSQTVIDSYDPNDIRVLEGEEILFEDIDKYLHYIIRFQNTGTASAINVRVNHPIDSKLDWQTMKLESLSHEGRVEIINGNEINFIFDDINLPDSNSDEPNSHGYIAFKIKPKSSSELGDVINGVANIFFDFNLPIITNIVSTQIVDDSLSINDLKLFKAKVYPNPVKQTLFMKVNDVFSEISVFDINGRRVKIKPMKISNKEYCLNVENLSSGFYFMRIESKKGSQLCRFVKE